MAVTIQTSPQLFTPSDNPIVWTFSSNTTTSENFSFLVELYIDSVLTGIHQVYPEASTYAHFNASDIVKTSIDISDINQSTLVGDALNHCEVYIIVKEYFGATPSVGATATSSTITSWKARLNDKEFSNYDYTDYNGVKFLTDSPNDLLIREGSNFFLTLICNYEYYLNIKLYNALGVLVDTIYYEPVNIDISQINLNTTILASAFIDDTSYIEIFISDTATELVLSETKRFYINRGCQNGFPLYWLNKYGAFDTFDFSFNAIYSSDITSKSYEKQFGEWSETDFIFNASNSGVLSFFKSASDTLQLVSNYINQSTQNWLVRSCYISPVVYMLDTTYDRVVIENTAYTENQDRFIEDYTEIVTLKLPNIRKSIVV